MSRLAALVLLVATVGSNARAQDPEFIYAAQATVTAPDELALARARDKRLEEIRSQFAGSRVLWRRADRDRGPDGQLLARLHVVLSATAPLSLLPEGVQLLGETSPAQALALRAIRFVVTDHEGATDLRQETRDAVLRRVGQRGLNCAERELSWLLRSARTSGTAWQRIEVRQEVDQDQDTIWVRTHVDVHAVFLGPREPLPSSKGHVVKELTELVVVCEGRAGCANGPAAVPAAGSRALTSALDHMSKPVLRSEKGGK